MEEFLINSEQLTACHEINLQLVQGTCSNNKSIWLYDFLIVIIKLTDFLIFCDFLINFNNNWRFCKQAKGLKAESFLPCQPCPALLLSAADSLRSRTTTQWKTITETEKNITIIASQPWKTLVVLWIEWFFFWEFDSRI